MSKIIQLKSAQAISDYVVRSHNVISWFEDFLYFNKLAFTTCPILRIELDNYTIISVFQRCYLQLKGPGLHRFEEEVDASS